MAVNVHCAEMKRITENRKQENPGQKVTALTSPFVSFFSYRIN